MLVRHASKEGTANYKERFTNRLHPSHFSLHNGLWFSSIGVGVCVTDNDPATTGRFVDSLAGAIEAGCNHIDATISHRSEQSEQVVGQTLAASFARGRIARDEVIVAARGGSILFGDTYPAEAAAHVRTHLVDAGVAAADDFAQGWHHCISPKYLRMRFRQCLTNLGLGTVDIYYVQNPEVHRLERGPRVFGHRLLAAFAELETQVAAERLAYYGVASQEGFRAAPGSPAYLSLARLVQVARQAGGVDHHFRYVQAPLNVAMREILESKNQMVGGTEMTLLEAAQALGITVVGGATLWQGQLAGHLPEHVREALPEAQTGAQAAIQFSRSAPGLASALVGMSSRKHVQENLAVARWPRAPVTRLTALL